jgi:hypothetical protein
MAIYISFGNIQFCYWLKFCRTLCIVMLLNIKPKFFDTKVT